MLLVILVALLFRHLWLSQYQIVADDTNEELLANVEFVNAPPAYTKAKSSYPKQSTTVRPKSKSVAERMAAAPKFTFDPNTISADSLTMLGVPAYIGSRLEKYRAKGGQFRKPADLARLYGIEEYYPHLEPWIHIPEKISNQTANIERVLSETATDSTGLGSIQPRAHEEPDYRRVVDLNTADSSSLLFLTGIGPFYAKTILEYREKLGGYIHVGQLAEAYGTPDTIVQTIGREWLTIDSSHIAKININTADFRTLIRHPYLNKPQVNAILTYRQVHGNYHSVEDIQKIHLISDEDYARLRHYLSVAD